MLVSPSNGHGLPLFWQVTYCGLRFRARSVGWNLTARHSRIADNLEVLGLNDCACDGSLRRGRGKGPVWMPSSPFQQRPMTGHQYVSVPENTKSQILDYMR